MGLFGGMRSVTLRDWYNVDHYFDTSTDGPEIVPTLESDKKDENMFAEWQAAQWVNMTPGSFVRETVTNLVDISSELKNGNKDIRNVFTNGRRLRSVAALVLVVAMIAYIS
jgi:hypothetical protein